MSREEKRKQHGRNFEDAVQVAGGPLQLRHSLLADLAKRENELCDLSNADRERIDDRRAELEKFKLDTMKALKRT